MASKYLQKYPVPVGFNEVLTDLTRQILRDQPNNIIEYSAKYFQLLEQGKKMEFDSKYNVGKEDKKYTLAYNAKGAEEITKKASNIAVSIENHTETPKIQSKQEVEQFVKEMDERVAEKSIEAIVEEEFAKFDLNKNGYLQSNEIQNYLKVVVEQSGAKPESVTQEDVAQFIREIDANRDGKVSQQELLEFIRKCT